MSSTASGSDHSVLIVEDDESIAFLLQFMLEREGYNVTLAADGRAAQTTIEDMTQTPALILLDVMLPYLDGIGLLQLVRQKSGWQHIPVIMLTAKSQETDIVRALNLGATDYVVKPFQPNELIARIQRLLKPVKKP